MVYRFMADARFLHHRDPAGRGTSRSVAAVFVTLLMTGYWLSPVQGAGLTAAQQRFMDAVRAIEKGDTARIEALLKQSRGDLLYPYLRYYVLRANLKHAAPGRVEDFLSRYSDYPFAALLRTRWLRELAERKQWRAFVRAYRPAGDAELQCHYLRQTLSASRARADRNRWIKQAKALWLVGRTQPKACIPVFNYLYDNGLISTAMIWQRIAKAMDAGDLKLASFLAGKLNRRDREAVKRWQAVYRDPARGLRQPGLRPNTLINRQIVEFGLRRLARQDAERAKRMFSQMRGRYGFSAKTLAGLRRYMALRGAYQLHPDALRWLEELEPAGVDTQVRVWRARLAIRQQRWPLVNKVIGGMSEAERRSEQWRYWRARAWAQIGEKAKADRQFSELAKLTHYYGFLAADQLHRPYRIAAEPLPRDEKRMNEIRALPGIARAKELYTVKRLSDARREWQAATRDFDDYRLQLAALIAHEWGWHDVAITTVSRTDHRRDFSLRFPLPYLELVERSARHHGIDRDWIYGVARRESLFNRMARSPAGALGLMQLMPATARGQSRQLGWRPPSTEDLFVPEKNLYLGSAYLSTLLERFSGNLVLATAAYNAGPNRVKQWLPAKAVPADVWIESIPFRETREYVKAVLAYSVIFNWQLDKEITPLRARMARVGGI